MIRKIVISPSRRWLLDLWAYIVSVELYDFWRQGRESTGENGRYGRVVAILAGEKLDMYELRFEANLLGYILRFLPTPREVMISAQP